MKHIGTLLALSLVTGRCLAAQDTSKAAAPAPSPAPAAAPATQITVDEAAIAKSVLDRVPQDTGSAFPADVGQLICWTKVTGAGGASIRSEERRVGKESGARAPSDR